jgi:hypothetical protein
MLACPPNMPARAFPQDGMASSRSVALTQLQVALHGDTDPRCAGDDASLDLTPDATKGPPP